MTSYPRSALSKHANYLRSANIPEANMNAKAVKNEKVSRTELLFNEQRLLDLHEKYGDETEIKKHVKTPAFIYEIRTALKFWKGERATHRTNDALWTRLEAFQNGHDEEAPEEFVGSVEPTHESDTSDEVYA